MNAEYWNQRYIHGKTGWDLGHISGGMKHLIDGFERHDNKILVPGAGNAFEVEYLWQKGFTNVYLLDWAEFPLAAFAARNPEFPTSQLLQKDFFELEEVFDLILEQTFFCSLPPDKRPDYVSKMHDLLKPTGRLCGILFNAPMHSDRPPYGGSMVEYRQLFSRQFKIIRMEPCLHSEQDRIGLEVEFDMLREPD